MSKFFTSLILLSTLLLPNLALAQVEVTTSDPEEATAAMIREPLSETESDLAETSDSTKEEITEETQDAEPRALDEDNSIHLSPSKTKVNEFFQSLDLLLDDTLSINDQLQARNLYAFAGDMFLNQNVNGDLFGLAGSTVLNSDIQEDAFLLAGELTINSNINGDLRAAAGDMVLNGSVEGDLLLAAGEIYLGADSLMNGEGVINAASVILDGPINGNFIINAGVVEINNVVNGNLKINAEQIEFADTAKVNGDFAYTSPEVINRLDKFVSGNIDFTEIHVNKDKFERFDFDPLKNMIKLISGLLIVSLLTLIFRNHLPKLMDLAMEDALMRSVAGLTTLITVPIVAFMLLFTVVAIPLSGIAILSYFLLLLLSKYLAAIFVGSYVMKEFTSAKKYDLSVRNSIVGFVILFVIKLIPILGALVSLLLLFLTLGTLVIYLFNGLGLRKS